MGHSIVHAGTLGRDLGEGGNGESELCSVAAFQEDRQGFPMEVCHDTLPLLRRWNACLDLGCQGDEP